MFNQLRIKYLGVTVLAFTFISSVDIPLPFTHKATGIGISNQAQAQANSSGGRSGGGSFRSNSSQPSNSSKSSNSNRQSSQNRSSNSNYSGGSSTYSPERRYRPYPHPHHQILVIPGSSNGEHGGATISINSLFTIISMVILLGLIILVFVVGGVQSALSKIRKPANVVAVAQELENNLVTISKLQVALFAHAPEVQSQLTQLSLEINTGTSAGLVKLLQESALALLRHRDYWSHALTSSESLDINGAESRFNLLSVEELSKFSTLTLANVNGKIEQSPVEVKEDSSSAYIVVTLLTGTKDDKPLFGRVHSTEELQSALEKLAALPSDYLIRFELLWSPQTASDSLSYDDLLAQYNQMIQLV